MKIPTLQHDISALVTELESAHPTEARNDLLKRLRALRPYLDAYPASLAQQQATEAGLIASINAAVAKPR